jgi:hypothetical protein
MRIFVARPGFQRHPLQRLLLGVGVVGVIAIAAVGAVLGLVLLTVGALAHFGLRALRGATAPAPRANAVLDGEYTVVARAVAPRQIPRAS